MKFESIAECSTWSILQYFLPALSDNWSWKRILGVLGCFWEWSFYTGFTVYSLFQVMGSKMSKTHSGDKIPNLNQSTWTNLMHVRSSSTSLDVSFRSLSLPIVNTIMSPFFWRIRFRRTNNLDVTHTGTPSLTMPLTIFCTFGQLGWIVLENLWLCWYTHWLISNLVRLFFFLRKNLVKIEINILGQSVK